MRAAPGWLPYLDLACVATAGALWYAWRPIGPWPLVLALAPWGLRLALTGWLTRRTPFDLPLLVFLLTAGMAVWTAYDRPAAWHKFWLIAGGVLFFYALANARPLGDRRVWLLGFAPAGLALFFLASHDWDALPAKVEALAALGRALQRPLPHLFDGGPHPNIVGGALALLLPFTGQTVVQWGQRLREGQNRRSPVHWLLWLASLAALAVALFGLLMTVSRGAWLALAAVAALAALWRAAEWLSRDEPGRRAWLLPGLLFGVVILGLGVGLAWPDGLFTVVRALPGPDTTLGRADLLRSAPILVHDYPIVGAGLDNFQMLYSTYALLIHVGFTTHSHNFYLNVAIEQGLLGLGALLVAWGLVAAAAWRGLLSPSRRAATGGLGAAALSLVAIALHGLVDNALYASHGVLLLFIPLAFAVPALQGWGRGMGRRLVLPVVLGVLLAGAVVWRGPLLSRIYSNLGAVRQSRAELSVYAWPEWPIQDEVRRQVNLEGAVAHFERALAFDSGNATAHRRLGMIALAMGQYESALEHLGAAYAAEPWSPTTRQLYGEALVVNGRVAEGRALWAEVNDGQGQLDIRAFWYQHVGDEQRAAWVREAASGK